MQRRLSVFLLTGLVVAGIGGKRAPSWAAYEDQVALFTDAQSFAAATGAVPLDLPSDAAPAFPDQPLGPGLVDDSCTDALAGVDLPFGAFFPTANLWAPAADWLCVLGPLWNGGPANIDPQPVSPTFVVNGDDDFELSFDLPVYAVGVRLLTNFAADETVTLVLEDGEVVEFDDADLGTAPNELAFVGFKSRRGIVAVSIDSEGGDVQNEGLAALASADVFQVRIDVKPGNQQNPVNCKSRGKIPVAILSEPGFIAPLHVDPDSLLFGATGEEYSLAFCKGRKDVNKDRLPDLVCHFYTEDAEFCFEPYPGEATLTGFTMDGTPIAGSDLVRIVPPGGRGSGSGNGGPKDKPPKDKPPKPPKDDDEPGNGWGRGNGRGPVGRP
jgi:hypothetical protein